MARFRKVSHARSEYKEGRHRFEHWYRDNTVYFITAKCRDGRAMFDAEDAKRIFWDRFTHWATYFGFVPWVTTLLLEVGIARALELRAFLPHVEYARYARGRARG